jgi:DNA-binding PadR family transcriptional regulator
VHINELWFLVLTALADGPRHGYAILKEVEALTDGAVKPQVATLYRTVDRLEADGLIGEHASEVVDGRFRRSYRLTDQGRSELAAEAVRRAETARVATERLRRSAPDLGLAGGAA